MKLLSPEEVKTGTEKRLNEAANKNLSLLRRINGQLDNLAKAKADYSEEKKKATKEFELFLKDIQARKSGMLRDLKDLQEQIDRKQDIYDMLTEKEDELVEREFQVMNKEMRLKEREKFVAESEKRVKTLWAQLTDKK